MTTALRGYALHDSYAEIAEFTQRPLSRSFSAKARRGREGREAEGEGGRGNGRENGEEGTGRRDRACM